MDAVEASARECIRDTIARYAHCADGGRFAELAALFADGGTLEIDGRPPVEGRRAIEELLSGVRVGGGARNLPAWIRHHVSSILIELDSPDEARAASYFFVITAAGPDHWGRYRDRLRRVGDRWLFEHRRVRLDGRAATSAL